MMDKIDELLKQEKKLFHTSDLAVLWDVQNKNTLRKTISRYTKRGILRPIYRGFYATIDLKEIDPIKIGLSAIHEFAYLSTETILAREGFISRGVDQITFVSRSSKKFLVGPNQFIVRKLRTEFLFNDAGIVKKDGVLTASPERAVADMFYFDPSFHFDGNDLIDWKKVREIKRKVGYK